MKTSQPAFDLCREDPGPAGGAFEKRLDECSQKICGQLLPDAIDVSAIAKIVILRDKSCDVALHVGSYLLSEARPVAAMMMEDNGARFIQASPSCG
ncbi:hypothetical protein X739_24800 [Mesorhizobium sp. LNHC220B00]|nr:hypothetical protein X739_24800 [Mesorhizobium sp. LNHC220B00]ESY91342.1 hypothetical protein X741_24220 [Mesorhizobium sp. LNHC229A00]